MGDTKQVRLIYFLIGFLLTMTVFLSVTCILYRQDFKTATASDYEAINGIGMQTALEIVRYISINPDCCIEDLDNVAWIGEKKLDLIRKEFR